MKSIQWVYNSIGEIMKSIQEVYNFIGGIIKFIQEVYNSIGEIIKSIQEVYNYIVGMMKSIHMQGVYSSIVGIRISINQNQKQTKNFLFFWENSRNVFKIGLNTGGLNKLELIEKRCKKSTERTWGKNNNFNF